MHREEGSADHREDETTWQSTTEQALHLAHSRKAGQEKTPSAESRPTPTMNNQPTAPCASAYPRETSYSAWRKRRNRRRAAKAGRPYNESDDEIDPEFRLSPDEERLKELDIADLWSRQRGEGSSAKVGADVVEVVQPRASVVDAVQPRANVVDVVQPRRHTTWRLREEYIGVDPHRRGISRVRVEECLAALPGELVDQIAGYVVKAFFVSVGTEATTPGVNERRWNDGVQTLNQFWPDFDFRRFYHRNNWFVLDYRGVKTHEAAIWPQRADTPVKDDRVARAWADWLHVVQEEGHVGCLRQMRFVFQEGRLLVHIWPAERAGHVRVTAEVKASRRVRVEVDDAEEPLRDGLVALAEGKSELEIGRSEPSAGLGCRTVFGAAPQDPR